MAYPSLRFTPAGGAPHQLKRKRTGAMNLHVVEGRYGPSEVRGHDITIPTMPGQRRRNRVFHERMIVVAGYVQGVGADLDARRISLDALMLELETIFDQTLGEGVLEDTRADGSVKLATVQVESVQYDDPTLDFYLNIPSIEMSAIELPVWTDAP